MDSYREVLEAVVTSTNRVLPLILMTTPMLYGRNSEGAVDLALQRADHVRAICTEYRDHNVYLADVQQRLSSYQMVFTSGSSALFDGESMHEDCSRHCNRYMS